MTRRCFLSASLFLLGCLGAWQANPVRGAQPPQEVPLDKARQVWTIPWDADWVTAVTFLGPTRRLAVGNKLGQILIFDLPDKGGGPFPPPLRRLEGHTNTITALASSPDGRWLISASYDHTVRIWDTQAPATGKGTAVLKGEKAKKGKSAEKTEFAVEVQQAHKALTAHAEWVRSLSLSRDGARLLSGDDKGVSILWDMPAGKELRRWQVKGWLPAVALTPDAGLAVTCEFAQRYAEFPNAVRLWDAATGQVKLDLGPSLKRGTGANNVIGMAAAAFSGDGKILALGQGGEQEGGMAKVFLMSVADGKKIRELSGHMYGVTAVVFLPDGQHLASTGRDTTVRVWRVGDGKQVAELGKGRGGQFQDWIHGVAVTADGRWLAAADMAGQIHVWTFGQQ